MGFLYATLLISFFNLILKNLNRAEGGRANAHAH